MKSKTGLDSINFCMCRDASEQELLRAAAAVEAGTRHPVADAVRHACEARSLSVPEAQEAQSQPGEGASCSLDGQQV